MTSTIDRELDWFVSFPERAGAHLTVERLADYGWLVRPRGVVSEVLPGGKRIALTLMGITHGNEWAGLAVLNHLLALLDSRVCTLTVPVAFLLGNPWAARENRRFRECDLNRSFARPAPTLAEEQRAADLAPVLADSAYLVDFHQTARVSGRPFFIFPFNRNSFGFARDVAPRLTVVTHWGKPFSAEGMCTDEYVNSQGGTGISLELGQNGFDPYQIAVGVEASLWALQAATHYLRDGVPPGRLVASRLPAEPEIYTWAEIVPWPAQGVVELDEDWTNFKSVAQGQALGKLDGRPLLAPASGLMLFPKFLTREQQANLTTRPTELCRIMRRVGVDALPE